jgi:hypothetical protein
MSTSVAKQIYFELNPLILVVGKRQSIIGDAGGKKARSESDGDASLRSNSAAYQALIPEATLGDFVGKQR